VLGVVYKKILHKSLPVFYQVARLGVKLLLFNVIVWVGRVAPPRWVVVSSCSQVPFSVL
jgi:hypothetical protein